MKPFLWITLTLTLGLGLWQNCSQVKLTPLPAAPPVAAMATNVQTTICPQVQPGAPEAANFLFVIAMDSENIAGWVNPNNGPYYYSDPTLAIDATGARFQAVKYFLTNCATQANAQYAVIGFSNAAGVPSGTGSGGAWSCDDITFGSAAQASRAVDALAQVQTAAAPWYLQWSQATNNYLTGLGGQPPLVRGTNYDAALKCAQHIVVSDLTSGSSAAETYQVVFIAGYNPDEEDGTGCNQSGSTPAQVQACELQAINTDVSYLRQAALTEAKDLRLYSVVYGDTQKTTSQFQNALASDGGTAAPMYLSSFQDNLSAICKLVASQFSVLQSPDSFFAVNMTTINKNDVLYADSDMDGLTDSQELALGYDPANPRSQVSGVLDGICERLGGLQNCRALRAQLQCDPTKSYNLLTDCDVQMLKLAQVPVGQTVGVDYDGDGIPDFLEIIKGTNPNVADALGDPDGDGLSNGQEISQGSDPFAPDAGFPAQDMNLVDVRFDPNASTCSDGGWVLSIKQFATSPTVAVKGLGGNLAALNHGAGAQVFWLGYRLVPVNSSNVDIQYFSTTISVPSANTAQAITLAPLGELLPP